MRELTQEEKARRERRQAAFQTFFEESRPVLVDFMRKLELLEPHLVLVDAARFLAPVDDWMKKQAIQQEDRVWIVTRLGYFIGELLNQSLGGYWFLDEELDSPYFLHYVVGRFAHLSNEKARVSPFALADQYASEPPGRSLSSILAKVEEELRRG
jgi:hypothetical protein